MIGCALLFSPEFSAFAFRALLISASIITWLASRRSGFASTRPGWIEFTRTFRMSPLLSQLDISERTA